MKRKELSENKTGIAWFSIIALNAVYKIIYIESNYDNPGKQEMRFARRLVWHRCLQPPYKIDGTGIHNPVDGHRQFMGESVGTGCVIM